jgi:hypothetical protein
VNNHAPRNWKNLEEMDKFLDIYKSKYEGIRKLEDNNSD